MGLMDRLFGASGATAATGIPSTLQAPSIAGQGTPTVANPALASMNHGAPAPAPVAAPAPAPAPAAPSSPLDSFAHLWETPKDDKGNVIQVTDPLSTPVFNIDPAKVTESARTLDFTKDVKPELMSELVTQDGRLDTAKLLELLNTVQQSAFAAATLANSNMMQQALLKNNQNLKTALPASINRATLDGMDVGEHPVLQHAAVQPLVKALRTMQLSKNPNASPQEIAKSVNDYILGLSTAIVEQSPTAVEARKTADAATTDFMSYMGR